MRIGSFDPIFRAVELEPMLDRVAAAGLAAGAADRDVVGVSVVGRAAR